MHLGTHVASKNGPQTGKLGRRRPAKILRKEHDGNDSGNDAGNAAWQPVAQRLASAGEVQQKCSIG